MYSFNKVKSAEGPCFANPFFLRDREDLLKFIKRKPEKKKKKNYPLFIKFLPLKILKIDYTWKWQQEKKKRRK